MVQIGLKQGVCGLSALEDCNLKMIVRGFPVLRNPFAIPRQHP
jgi:hypothetical protein